MSALKREPASFHWQSALKRALIILALTFLPHWELSITYEAPNEQHNQKYS